jgi:peroxidase
MLKSVKDLPSEREAEDNALFGAMKGGFDTINTIKARLEKACPRVVSCADIIAAAAKQALILVRNWDSSMYPTVHGEGERTAPTWLVVGHDAL